MSNYTSIDNLIMTTYASIESIKRMWNIDSLCVEEMKVLSFLIIQTPFGCEYSDKIIKGLYEDLNSAVVIRKEFLQKCANHHH